MSERLCDFHIKILHSKKILHEINNTMHVCFLMYSLQQAKQWSRMGPSDRYLTATEIQINYMFAVLHQVCYTYICNPETQMTFQNSLKMNKASTSNMIWNTNQPYTPYIPIDRKDLQIRASTGYSFNSLIRDLLAAIKIQNLQVLKRI